MIAHKQRLAPINLQSINDIVIIVEQPCLLDGRRELHVEGIDERTVKVHPQMQRARKLTQHIVPFGVQAGNAVRDHGFVIDFGR